MQYFMYYFAGITFLSYFLMGLDKYKAIRNKWRIPEKVLFLSAILGGSIGSVLGMYMFHHKTKHASFRIGLPVILLLQVALGMIGLYWYFSVR